MNVYEDIPSLEIIYNSYSSRSIRQIRASHIYTCPHATSAFSKQKVALHLKLTALPCGNLNIVKVPDSAEDPSVSRPEKPVVMSELETGHLYDK